MSNPFEHLRDIRDLRVVDGGAPIDASPLVMERAHNVALMGEAPETPARPRDIEPVNAMHVLLMVVRGVYRHLAPEWRLTDTNADKELGAVIERAEMANPLLRLAWQHLGPEPAAAKELAGALESFRVRNALLVKPNAMVKLLESDIMLDTLWSRDPLVLYHPVLFAQCMTEPVDGQWQVANCDLISHRERAKQSLLWWLPQYGPLAAFVEQQFGLFVDEDTAQRYCYRFNEPAVLRVHSKVHKNSFATAKEAHERHSFEALRELEIDGCDYAPNADGTGLQKTGRKTKYVLVMVVRLHDDQQRGRILVRRYLPSGVFIDEPDHFQFHNRNWRLSDASGNYLLYYHICGDTSSYSAEAVREAPRSDPDSDVAAERRRVENVFLRYNPAGPN
ncbi:uncharacterized protein PG998_002915 [Apiospora kogelbergensis]|uniref:uncharacterized protein n=1 Tax=Apiospora kogelbergensis TaxID=1337665 RepID=UPI0031312A0F